MDKFHDIYVNNLWRNSESRSGRGSSLEWAEVIMPELVSLIKELEVESFLDIPCGDFNWMKEIVDEIPEYIGADVVPKMIEDNKEKYPDIDFRVLSVIDSPLPQVDMLFCRDCLVHLKTENVKRSLKNIKAAKPKYVVLTHFPPAKNIEIEDGNWRALNMNAFLDDSYEEIKMIKERANNKYLGVWKCNY